MKTLSTMILAGGLAASVLLFGVPTASAQSRTIQGDSLTVSATVVAIDVQTRTVTTKNDKGVYETLHAPDDMKRFSELKVGDKITAKYYENVVIRMKKPNEPAVDVDSAAVTPGTGAKPAGTAASQRTITVAVTALDPKTQAVTVTGPNGYVYSRHVIDKKSYDLLKVGDRLDMTWTDALLVSVDPAK